MFDNIGADAAPLAVGVHGLVKLTLVAYSAESRINLGLARMAFDAQQPGSKGAPHMKSRVFSFTSLLALLVAMMASPAAMAETSPAQDVYNPNGEVLDVVEGGGETLPENASGGCDEADGLDADGNPVTTGSDADCAENTPAPTPDREVADVCAEADGQDSAGNTVAYGSAEDCSAATTPTVSQGELPFTGFEAGMVALAGLALLGGGFAMRRVARRDSV